MASDALMCWEWEGGALALTRAENAQQQPTEGLERRGRTEGRQSSREASPGDPRLDTARAVDRAAGVDKPLGSG